MNIDNNICLEDLNFDLEQEVINKTPQKEIKKIAQKNNQDEGKMLIVSNEEDKESNILYLIIAFLLLVIMDGTLITYMLWYFKQ